jgi:1-acyl-sn-glycerol-3-phosphate acyltransferase
VLKYLFRDFRAIAICSGKEDPQTLARAYASVSEELRAGELVCIFPEGRLTDTGELNPFHNEVSRILAENPVPVVPLALRGLWGSFFSRRYGAAMSSPLRARPLLKIGIVAGPPLAPGDATPARLQAKVAALRGEAC